MMIRRRYTSVQLLHGRSSAQVSPTPTSPPSLVPYTNRHFGHQMRYTKRLTIAYHETSGRLGAAAKLAKVERKEDGSVRPE